MIEMNKLRQFIIQRERFAQYHKKDIEIKWNKY